LGGMIEGRRKGEGRVLSNVHTHATTHSHMFFRKQAYEAQRKAWVQSAMTAGQQQRPDGQQGGSDQASKGAARSTLPEPTCSWRQVRKRASLLLLAETHGRHCLQLCSPRLSVFSLMQSSPFLHVPSPGPSLSSCFPPPVLCGAPSGPRLDCDILPQRGLW
jgi:hypothetical protein